MIIFLFVCRSAPWIDKLDARLFKIRDIASDDGQAVNERRGLNQSIAFRSRIRDMQARAATRNIGIDRQYP